MGRAARYSRYETVMKLDWVVSPPHIVGVALALSYDKFQGFPLEQVAAAHRGP